VNEAKNFAEDFCVVRILLETNELGIDHINALVRLGEEFAQQLVHGEMRLSGSTKRAQQAPFESIVSVLVKRLILVHARIACPADVNIALGKS
jgi:hypothetical protein